jgi:hypothetical protein
VVTAAPAKKVRVSCATSIAPDPRATPVTPAAPGIDASGTAASTPTHRMRPGHVRSASFETEAQLPSAASLPPPRRSRSPHRSPQARNCGSADSLAWPGLRSISESSTSTRSMLALRRTDALRRSDRLGAQQPSAVLLDHSDCKMRRAARQFGAGCWKFSERVSGCNRCNRTLRP